MTEAEGWSIRIANLTATGGVAIRGQSSYHPKAYFAYEPSGVVKSVVGSAKSPVAR